MKALVVSAVLLAWVSVVQAAPTVTSPGAGTTSVGPADDYATRAFQDPWDMNQYTDLGWFTLGNDSPPSGLSNITVAGGVFTANIINNDPNFVLLDTRVPGNAPLGKIGSNFPIASSIYRILMMSMCLNGAVPADSQIQVFWSNNTFFPSEPNGGFRNTTTDASNGLILSRAGCNIYYIDMATVHNVISATQAPISWSAAPVDFLRIDPTQYQITSPGTLSVDWVRLLPLDNANLQKTISWSSSGNVDVYLDTDSVAANGGQVQIAHNQGGTSLPFYIGGVAPGTYFVEVCDAGANPVSGSCGYSAGSYNVLALPTFAFTNPTDEGSTDDFATTQLGNSWDRDQLTPSDVDFPRFVTGQTTALINAVDEAGNDLGAVNVLAATSVPASVSQTIVGDPEEYLMFHTMRGLNYRIDADRYRILTLEMGLPGARDLVAGSVARIIWKIADSPSNENVSDDIDVNHRAVPGGAIVLAKISADMKDSVHMPNETDPGGSPDNRGWINGFGPNPGLDSFRVDPHEFSPATAFYIRRVKLAALQQVGSSFNIAWNYTNPSSVSTTLTLIAAAPVAPGATPSCSASGAITIASNVPLSPGAGSFNWTGPSLNSFTDGSERHLCAQVFQGGTFLNEVISKYPIKRSSTFSGTLPPTLVADRSRVNFGGTNNGTLVSLTPAQTITLNEVGTGTVNWTVSSNQGWLNVSPASGSGTGNFTLTVVGPGTSLPAVGLQYATVTISSPDILNSPQYIDVYLNLIPISGTQAPFGSFDTPTNGLTGVQGAIGVTGWALDDIGVSKLELWRDRVNGDPPPAANGKIFIGNATFVNGARSDVDSLYSTYPLSYRGAWGYALLTNLLPVVSSGAPAGGVGTFTLYAYVYDNDGHVTLLPSRTFTCDNATGANKPFGTIDTPGQGDTVSGTIHNFGWALTPQPAFIPTDGHTITLFIDNVPRGTAQYNFPRSDLASYFPGYQNTPGPVGHFLIDTTTLANGVHTIAWSVADNLGRADGLGSRYFTVLN